jgi:tricorn protease-like protein
MPEKSRMSIFTKVSLVLFGILAFFFAATDLAAQSNNQYALLRKPTVSKTQIAFSYGGDLWVVDRTGGEARRLTSDVGIEIDPIFSPDGSMIAFTGEYDGNEDVYVIPTAGGIPAVPAQNYFGKNPKKVVEAGSHRRRKEKDAFGGDRCSDTHSKATHA